MRVIFFIVCVLFYKPSMQYPGSLLQIDYVAVQVGQDVTFHCFHPQEQMNRIMWYKQTLEGKLALVASSYFWTQKSELFDEFKESKRFKVTASIDSFNLTIHKPVRSDLAAYFCAGSFTNIVFFLAGTKLVLKGSISDNIQFLQPPQQEMALSSGNVTLQCTIQIKQSCGGEHKVYLLKHSGKTHSRIFHTQKHCEDDSENSDKICIYSLYMRNIKPSDAGTYYCAVDTCGEILFGRGINLTFDDESKLILIGLAALMSISFISNIVFCVTRTKGNTSQQVQTTTDAMSTEQFSSTADVNYAALKFTNQSSRRHRKDSRK